MDFAFRTAEPDDAPQLAEIVSEASGGIIDFLLKGVIPGVSPTSILESLALDEDSTFHYTNAIVIDNSPGLCALLLAYPWSDNVVSDLTRQYISKKKVAVLEQIISTPVEDSLYINTIWIEDKYRGTGLADLIMDYAEYWAGELSFSRLSLNVWADNARALAFYKRHNFSIINCIDIKPHKLLPHEGGNLVLSKDLDA